MLKPELAEDRVATKELQRKKPIENQWVNFFQAVRTGLEPATSCVTGRHSNQLNYHSVLLDCKYTASKLIFNKKCKNLIIY